MPTILITGANRGLGLELARQYGADGWRVIATARHPGKAEELKALGVAVETLEQADEASIRALAARLAGEQFDLLICNAGIYGSRGSAGEVPADEWLHTLHVNCVAPARLAAALLPSLVPGGKVIAITSQMGSIADNKSGGSIAYRTSKAALNAAWKTLSIDWRGRAILALFHPGWVQTDMGGPSATITAEESVRNLRSQIEALTPDRSGIFLNHDGAELPW